MSLVQLPEPRDRATASTVHNTPVRVMIIDDDPRVLDGLEVVIRSTHNFECVGRLTSADGLIEGIVRTQPDLVLLDLDMPGRNVIDAIVEVCRYRRHPVKIVMLSGTDERWAIETALAVGASGYIVKLDGTEAIRRAIREVMEGKVSLSPTAAKLIHRRQTSDN